MAKRGPKLGYRQTLEHRYRRSQALKGQEFSPERRARISAALRGRKLTPEHIANATAARKAAQAARKSS